MKLKQSQDKYDKLHETRFGERERCSEIENEPEIELAAPVQSSIADGMYSVFLRGLTAKCEERNSSNAPFDRRCQRIRIIIQVKVMHQKYTKHTYKKFWFRN